MKLAEVFSDSMVLQRDMPIKIFGTGSGTVTVDFDGETAKSESSDGRWYVELKPRSSGGPYEMHIDLSGKKITLTDIMIGDVWLACGQSNMELPLFKTEGGIDEAQAYKNDNIRFYTVPRRYAKGRDVRGWNFSSERPQKPQWRNCGEKVSEYFSAVGYYFAKEIQAQTDVPVGVISCNWGGRRIETFVDRSHSMACGALREELEEFDNYVNTLDMVEYEKAYDEFVAEKERYYNSGVYTEDVELVKRLGARAAGNYTQSEGVPGSMEKGPYDSYSPTNLWETMFSELIPLCVKGMLWYQGESNCLDKDYIDKYGAFLKCIRDNFGYNMPVYAVELAGFAYWWTEGGGMHEEGFLPEKGAAYLREQQQRATEIYDNNYLVTSMDYGDLYEIHPTQKEEISKRLAKKALKYTYGFDIDADQPIYQSVRFEDSKAYITLKHGEGLFCLSLDQVDMFIGSEDGVVKKATVEIIDDNLLCVYSSEVINPKFVRYAFDNYYLKKHIYNRVGLPLAPFRTDK